MFSIWRPVQNEATASATRADQLVEPTGASEALADLTRVRAGARARAEALAPVLAARAVTHGKEHGRGVCKQGAEARRYGVLSHTFRRQPTRAHTGCHERRRSPLRSAAEWTRREPRSSRLNTWCRAALEPWRSALTPSGRQLSHTVTLARTGPRILAPTHNRNPNLNPNPNPNPRRFVQHPDMWNKEGTARPRLLEGRVWRDHHTRARHQRFTRTVIRETRER